MLLRSERLDKSTNRENEVRDILQLTKESNLDIILLRTCCVYATNATKERETPFSCGLVGGRERHETDKMHSLSKAAAA